MKIPIKTLVVDDTDYICSGICSHIQRENFSSKYSFEPVPLNSGEDAIEEVKRNDYQIAIVDYSMPGGMNGPESCDKMLQVHPALKVLGISAFNDIKNVIEFINAGALGFIIKNKIDDLCVGLENTADGKGYMSELVKKELDEFKKMHESGWLINSALVKFTKREKEILILLYNLYSDKEIATILTIERSTVYKNITNMVAESKVKDIHELLRISEPYIKKEMTLSGMQLPPKKSPGMLKNPSFFKTYFFPFIKK